MNYFFKFGVILALLTILTILYSCGGSSGMTVKTLLKMQRGMPESAYNNLLVDEKLTTEFTLDDIPGKKVKIKVFIKQESEIGYTFFVAFVDDMLYYWGYPYEYARHSDPLINEIGKKAYDKYKSTYKNED